MVRISTSMCRIFPPQLRPQLRPHHQLQLRPHHRCRPRLPPLRRLLPRRPRLPPRRRHRHHFLVAHLVALCCLGWAALICATSRAEVCSCRSRCPKPPLWLKGDASAHLCSRPFSPIITLLRRPHCLGSLLQGAWIGRRVVAASLTWTLTHIGTTSWPGLRPSHTTASWYLVHWLL